jgi:hypothetical protein
LNWGIFRKIINSAMNANLKEVSRTQEAAMCRAYLKTALRAFLVLGLLGSAAGVSAQQEIYKWVDEEGIVHFSEQPPRESPDGEVETIKTDPAPRYVPPAKTTIRPPPTATSQVAEESARPQVQAPAPATKVDISAMSLSDLDRRCEDAREEKIAPLRAAEIANCIESGTGDQAWCETFWADYGDPVRTTSGGLTPRRFHDLPECIEALDEQHRRVSR